MTCIVGVVHEGKVHIGGDSAGVAGYSMTVRADQKVFTNGKFVFGFTSSFRMGQVLRYAFTPPERLPSKSVDAYMVTDFIDAVRAVLKSSGYAQKDQEQEIGGTFLVGYEGRLFKIDCDYQVGESVDGYDACGCGQDIAVGALFATKAAGLDPAARVSLALGAAESYSAGVRGPFKVETV